jgi:hypothetical protein
LDLSVAAVTTARVCQSKVTNVPDHYRRQPA